MYTLGDFVEMKKPHACVIKETGKKANRWEIYATWCRHKN